MKIPRDKVLHFLAGALAGLVAVVCVKVSLHFGIHWAVVFVGAIVGSGYELLQKYRGEGSPEVVDAVATILGASAIAAGVWALLPA